ncbi:MAG: hypothetical protein Q4C68_04365 [Moraxella sp.]|nr:hypothetical protein [Moraxella sp.]
MCCKIDLNSSADAAHFLGKHEPKILPKTEDNIAPSSISYTGAPAMSLFDKLVAYFSTRLSA